MLQMMRRYIRTFFGCRECGRHFEQAAAVGMDNVQNREQQILWLWQQHNRVNMRLAGNTRTQAPARAHTRAHRQARAHSDICTCTVFIHTGSLLRIRIIDQIY